MEGKAVAATTTVTGSIRSKNNGTKNNIIITNYNSGRKTKKKKTISFSYKEKLNLQQKALQQKAIKYY